MPNTLSEKAMKVLSAIGNTVAEHPAIVTTPLGAYAGGELYKLTTTPEERAHDAYLKWVIGGGVTGLGVGGVAEWANKPSETAKQPKTEIDTGKVTPLEQFAANSIMGPLGAAYPIYRKLSSMRPEGAGNSVLASAPPVISAPYLAWLANKQKKQVEE